MIFGEVAGGGESFLWFRLLRRNLTFLSFEFLHLDIWSEDNAMCPPKLLFPFIYFIGHIFTGLLSSYMGPCYRLMAKGIWIESTHVTSIFGPYNTVSDPLYTSSFLTTLEMVVAQGPLARNIHTTFFWNEE